MKPRALWAAVAMALFMLALIAVIIYWQGQQLGAALAWAVLTITAVLATAKASES